MTDSKKWHTPSWDELFMKHSYLIATKSKDPHTKIGATIVRDNAIISEGFNGLPKGVDDNKSERFERPEKYYWCEHGERNAIYHCARNGIKTEGTTLYCFGIPCADCARAIIQSGIKKVVIHEQWEDVGINKNNQKWNESVQRSKDMFDEAGVKIYSLCLELGVETMIDGKIYEV